MLCMDPCHNGMGSPRVADGEDGLQMWIATSILNKQAWTADKRWPSGLEVGQGNNNSSPLKRKQLVTQGLRVGRILWNDLGSIWLKIGTSGGLL